MGRIEVGVIGVGHMGRKHVHLLSDMKESFHLCGVYDLDEKLVRSMGYTGKIFQSEDELMSNVEAVIIAAPSFLHKQLVLKAAEHNLHVLVEKPLSLSAKDAAEVCERYKALDHKVLMVGHVERFNPVVLELEKILGSEEIIAVTMERCSPMDMHISDTDVIYDLMIHDMDILLNAVFPGLPLHKVHAFGRTSYNEKNFDYVQAIFQFENKAQASIISSRATEDKIRRINVHCKEAYIECDLMHKAITISRNTHHQKVFVPDVEPLEAELSCFASSIAAGKALQNSGETAVKDLEVLDEIRNLVYGRSSSI